MDGVTSQSLHAEQEGQRRLELSRQEQHLEVEEGLLAGQEVGLSCQDADKENFHYSRESLGILSAWKLRTGPTFMEGLISGLFAH